MNDKAKHPRRGYYLVSTRRDEGCGHAHRTPGTALDCARHLRARGERRLVVSWVPRSRRFTAVTVITWIGNVITSYPLPADARS